jgi:transcriptional regulator with XRE-family HTH domain
VNIQNVNHGDLIRRTREAKGLTQAQVAEQLGVSQPAVSRMENAPPGDLTVAEIVALCRVLGLTWSDFEPGEAE